MFLTISPKGYNTRQDLPPKSGVGGNGPADSARWGWVVCPGGRLLPSFPIPLKKKESEREKEIERKM